MGAGGVAWGAGGVREGDGGAKDCGGGGRGRGGEWCSVKERRGAWGGRRGGAGCRSTASRRWETVAAPSREHADARRQGKPWQAGGRSAPSTHMCADVEQAVIGLRPCLT